MLQPGFALACHIGDTYGEFEGGVKSPLIGPPTKKAAQMRGFLLWLLNYFC
jgi:hypothetical protein